MFSTVQVEVGGNFMHRAYTKENRRSQTPDSRRHKDGMRSIALFPVKDVDVLLAFIKEDEILGHAEGFPRNPYLGLQNQGAKFTPLY